MPGKRITDHQVLQYKDYRRRGTQVAAAAKAGVSERSARRIDVAGALPSQRERRSWRTREDPLQAVWEAELQPLLLASPRLSATTLFEELSRRHPGEFAPSILRTLQRRVRRWRVTHGGEREIFFAQEHPPGRQGLSDFTVADSLGVTIGGVAFAHRIYQFTLAHSGWRHATVIESGESFDALAGGMQAALWNLGGAPEEHRTDSLSAAFRNLTAAEADDVTKRYGSLCEHYGMRASRCNPGESHENGSIESRHGSLKTALRQALLLRGTVDFADRAAYEMFLETIVDRMNARIEKALSVERPALRPLPERKTSEFTELTARVSRYGIFTVKGAQYSAPSRLIGYRLIVRQYTDRIECWLGGNCVLECPRATHANGARHPRRIDYRHMIGSLKKKPNAFARWIFREEAFPRLIFRQTWERLHATLPERDSCRLMVGLLALAADGHEAELAGELELLAARHELPNLVTITHLLAPRPTAVLDIAVLLPPSSVYDGLLEVVL
jgi:transposase InsO family protein